MKKRIQSVLCALMVFIIAACTLNATGEPYLVDRSEGWTPSMVFTTQKSVIQFNVNPESFYSMYFSGSELTEETTLPNPEPSDEELMRYCMELAFGARFIDIGRGEIQAKQINDQFKIYATDEAAVIVDEERHVLVQCVDTRLQQQFSETTPAQLRNGEFVHKTDIAQLTAEEVRQFYKYNQWTLLGGDLVVDKCDLPLSASGAFQIAVKGIYERYVNGPGSLGTIGGAFTVYYVEASNSWLIVGNKYFMQMLDKDTGECLLLMHPGEDLSVRK
jgi:hypothetical protein